MAIAFDSDISQSVQNGTAEALHAALAALTGADGFFTFIIKDASNNSLVSHQVVLAAYGGLNVIRFVTPFVVTPFADATADNWYITRNGYDRHISGAMSDIEISTTDFTTLTPVTVTSFQISVASEAIPPQVVSTIDVPTNTSFATAYEFTDLNNFDNNLFGNFIVKSDTSQFFKFDNTALSASFMIIEPVRSFAANNCPDLPSGADPLWHTINVYDSNQTLVGTINTYDGFEQFTFGATPLDVCYIEITTAEVNWVQGVFYITVIQ